MKKYFYRSILLATCSVVLINSIVTTPAIADDDSTAALATSGILAAGTTAAIAIALASNSNNNTTNYTYSNMMFFGDSQTEIGNGPENLTLYNSQSSSDGIAINVYVPISNPVNTETDSMLVDGLEFPPTTSISDFTMTLPPQLSICDANGICSARYFRSINWVEYFIYNATLNNRNLITPPIDLRPWIIQYSQSSPGTINQSVDYAWYSALSNDSCIYPNYTPVTCPTNLASGLYNAQENYRVGQSPTDPVGNRNLFNTVIIPNTQKQVELFADDLENNRVKVNDKTLYIIWTGANDLSVGFGQFIACRIQTPENNCLDTWTTYRNVTIPNEIAGPNNNNSVVNRLISLGAKHIFVIGQYDLGLTPEAGDARFIFPFSEWTSEFNNALKTDIEQIATNNASSGVTVKYIDIQDPINLAVAPGTGYALTVAASEKCDMPSGNAETIATKLLQGDAVSCTQDVDPKPIGWWNNAHISTQLNQVVANAVLNNV
ncbi:MAG: SGNH/GDSL hydrolase family protein [Pseudomonadota bacterium]